jgi:hypothetical protein
LALSTALCLAGTGNAQTAKATGPTSASVALGLVAQLPAALRLELDVTHLSYDLRSGRIPDDGPACRATDVADDPVVGSGLVDGRVAPAGTSFRSGAWPSIEVTGGWPLEAYPPAPHVDRVVCYRSFLARPFAGLGRWSLSATRSDVPDAPPLERLYVGGGCEGHEVPGLVPLDQGQHVTVATSLPAETRACDVVRVVVAVDLTAQAEDAASTTIRYTLVANDADFASQ